ncbi:MAG: hypothetical protein ACRBN8_32360 [Nannocystales bacterium]
MKLRTLSISLLLLGACTRSSAEPRGGTDVQPGDATLTPAVEAPEGTEPIPAPGTLEALSGCGGLDEATCLSTMGCSAGEGVEIKDVDGGHCRGRWRFAGCQTEQTSEVVLPAAAAACAPDGRQFYFQIQDTPDGWSGEFCDKVVDYHETPLCEDVTAEVVTSAERRMVARQLASDALESYLDTLKAYRRGDRESYFDGFAPELDCFYAETKNGRKALEKARSGSIGHGEVFAARTRLISASAEEVVFVDYGVYSRSYDEDSLPAGARDYVSASDDPTEQGTHVKLIVMKKDGRAWKIASETSRAHQDCVQPGILADVPMTKRFWDCSQKHRAALKACDEACGGAVPGHACFECPDAAWCELKSCLSIDSPLGESCSWSHEGVGNE